VAKRSSGAGDPHDRDVANPIARFEAPGEQKRSCGSRQPEAPDSRAGKRGPSMAPLLIGRGHAYGFPRHARLACQLRDARGLVQKSRRAGTRAVADAKPETTELRRG
jgi:hypothetical protein